MMGHCAEGYWTRLIKNNIETITGINENEFIKNYVACFLIDKDIFENYINGIFTKTICEAKNLNHLMKTKTIAEELGLVEDVDFGMIRDCCLTELTPENEDGTCTVGIWFKPLDDEIAHKISKSINRNIVECKDENGDILLNFVRVLIETQWNVKYGDTDNALELNMY